MAYGDNQEELAGRVLRSRPARAEKSLAKATRENARLVSEMAKLRETIKWLEVQYQMVTG